jgi:hypothetical protein
VYLGTPYGVPVAGTVFGYEDVVLGAPVWVQSRTTVVEMLLTKMPALAVKDRV